MTDITNATGVAQGTVVSPQSGERASVRSGDAVSGSRPTTAFEKVKGAAELVAQQAAAQVSTKENSTKDPFEKAAKELERFVPNSEFPPNTRLRISQDESTGIFVYQSIDNNSGEVRRQFPAEAILEFLSYYREVEGLAVDDEA